MDHRKDKNIYINIDDIIKENNISPSRKIQIERERELKKKQLKNVEYSKKLRSSDIHRIVQHTDNSIFDNEKCCLWNGYITNLKNKKKGTYINFYFKCKKKVALHRLIYLNYKGEISDNEYIKFTCPNKGICCNINHMIIFEYNSKKCIDDSDDYEELEEEEDIIHNDDEFKIVIY